MKWFKRYAIGFLIALLVLAGVDGYKGGPGHSIGATMLMAAAWPIVITMAVGGTIGDVVRCGAQGPGCADPADSATNVTAPTSSK